MNLLGSIAHWVLHEEVLRCKGFVVQEENSLVVEHKQADFQSATIGQG